MSKRGAFAGACVAGLLVCAAVASGAPQPETLQQLQDLYPAVHDSANAALVYQKARDLRVMSQYDNELPLLGGGKMPAIPAEPLAPHVKASIAIELERNAGVLQLLHQAAGMPQCRFPVDLTKGEAMELPHLAPMRDFERLLALQALGAADDKNAEVSAQAVLDGMAVAQSLKKEPIIIAQLVRIACWSIAVETLEQVINRVPLDENALLLLQQSLARADDREAITRALQGEFCVQMSLPTESAEEKAAREAAIAQLEEKMRAEEEARARAMAESGDDAPEDGDAAENTENREEMPAPGVQGELVHEIDPALYQPKLSPEAKQEILKDARRMVDESRLPYAKIMKLLPPPNLPAAGPFDSQRNGNGRGGAGPPRCAAVSSLRHGWPP